MKYSNMPIISKKYVWHFLKLLDYIAPFFVGDIFSLFLGAHLGEVFVDRSSKGTQMEHSISTGLEAGNKHKKQKEDYQEDELSYARSNQPKESMSLAIIEFSK